MIRQQVIDAGHPQPTRIAEAQHQAAAIFDTRLHLQRFIHVAVIGARFDAPPLAAQVKYPADEDRRPDHYASRTLPAHRVGHLARIELRFSHRGTYNADDPEREYSAEHRQNHAELPVHALRSLRLRGHRYAERSASTGAIHLHADLP